MTNIKDRFTEEKLLRYKSYGQKCSGVLYSIARYLVLCAVGFIVVYPLLSMIATSIQSLESMHSSVRIWIPTDFEIKDNFSAAIKVLNYGKSLGVTLLYAMVPAVLQIATCAIAAYGFARFNFKGKKILTAVLFLTILIPDILVVVPRMVSYAHFDFLGILGLVKKLTGVDLRPSLIDTVWAMYLPALFGAGVRSGILIYIYIQFFKGLPKELEEAAWVDGANPFRTFISIAIPSSGVVILTVTVFSLIWHWNESINTTMLLSNQMPLSYQMKYFEANIPVILVDTSVDRSVEGIKNAGCILFIAPMLIVYMIVQRWFIESIDRVGITG